MYCRQVWVKIRRLCQEACSRRKIDEKHHNTCQLSYECIRRFMEMTLGDVRCLKVIREWYDGCLV